MKIIAIIATVLAIFGGIYLLFLGLNFTSGLQSAVCILPSVFILPLVCRQSAVCNLISPHTGNEKVGLRHEYLSQPISDLRPKSGRRHSIYKDMPAGSNSRRSAPRARRFARISRSFGEPVSSFQIAGKLQSILCPFPGTGNECMPILSCSNCFTSLPTWISAICF